MHKNVPMTPETTFSLSLAALGIVYGDIGTSPLYAIRESLTGLSINSHNVLGVLSLIVWALLLVVSMKYLWVVLRADNDGEGGILALFALLKRTSLKKTLGFSTMLAIFGAGLMLGDGMLTPAISVISAVEGVNVVFPHLSNIVLPIACVILILLFYVQSHGSSRLGRFYFGPIIFIWFLVLAILGARNIFQNPIVLRAINPYYAIEFLITNGWRGYTLLGSVFLVVTGAEALYADLGHFGKNPIRYSWFLIVLPSLLLNYFGQGAHLLMHPAAISSPFYLMAPTWFIWPLIVIATAATIIASQAVISATFSLTKQAVLLGFYPRMPIIQTSESRQGQIYIPQMNFILAVGTLFLVLIFRNSSALAHAYGVAVNVDMLLTTSLIMYVAYTHWKWTKEKIWSIFAIILIIDLAFLGSNLQKIPTGGWMPIVFALICAFIMYTWNQGIEHLRRTSYTTHEDLKKIMNQLHNKTLYRLPDITAIYITDIYDKNGGGFLKFLNLSSIIPENTLIVNYEVENVPYVVSTDRFEIHCLDANICHLTLHYGFMDYISVPQALYTAYDRGLLPFDLNVEKANYLVEVNNILPSRKVKTLWFDWQEKLFAFLMRNYSSNLNLDFYQLPYEKTTSIGSYFMI